jgi:hypothetical protein
VSWNLRAFLDQVEAAGSRMAATGQQFAETSKGKMEKDERTFGSDKIGQTMYNPQRYKPGTVEDMLEECANTGEVIKELGEYLVQAARELRAGEDANERQHKATNTKVT